MAHTLSVALIQHAAQPTPDAALTYLAEQIKLAAERSAQLIVLPELHNTAYFCQTECAENFDLAESIPGPSSEHFAALAAKYDVVLIASLFERRAPGIYHNTAVVFERDGRVSGQYRKMHIPDDPGYSEKYYFTPGDLGFKPIQTSAGKLGVLVCWDQWFPEAARLMALQGADLLIYPTAIGWDPNDTQAEQSRQRDAWITVQRGHAIANGLPILTCNRIGFEAPPSDVVGNIGQQFWGSSFIAGPQGEILAQADTDTASVLTCTIDMNRSETVRRAWPFLRDRRIDAYQGLLSRFIDDDLG